MQVPILEYRYNDMERWRPLIWGMLMKTGAPSLTSMKKAAAYTRNMSARQRQTVQVRWAAGAVKIDVAVQPSGT